MIKPVLLIANSQISWIDFFIFSSYPINFKKANEFFFKFNLFSIRLLSFKCTFKSKFSLTLLLNSLLSLYLPLSINSFSKITFKFMSAIEKINFILFFLFFFYKYPNVGESFLLYHKIFPNSSKRCYFCVTKFQINIIKIHAKALLDDAIQIMKSIWINGN